MNNLEISKEKVRYWSKIGALTLTLVPTIIKLSKQEAPWNKSDWQGLSRKEKAFILGCLIVMWVITYYISYYTISSVFLPESLSMMNWILLIPCSVSTFLNVKENIQLLNN